MSVTSNLGKVMLTPRGTYSPTNSYEPLDIVVYSGSSYLVLQSVAGVTPSNDGSYYMLLASRGLQGQTGQAATVQIGTVTTVPYGTGSSVTNVGTQNNAVLDISLEQGPEGDVSTVDGVSATNGNVQLNAVKFVAQSLSSAQQTQARNNLNSPANPTKTTATLAVANWSGTEAPYLYTLTVTGVTATNTVVLYPDSNITQEQLEALQAANIIGSSQAANSLTLKAFGDKPEVAIPIGIIVGGDA